MMPALSACTSSPAPGTIVTIETSGGSDDVHFVLAHADCLDEDHVLAGRVEDEGDLAGRTRQPAEVAACRHAADEHAVVSSVRLHADAIAEDRAAGERARRIDRDDADAPAVRCETTRSRRSTSVLLPAPGGPVTPMRYALSGSDEELRARSSSPGGRLVFDQEDRASQGAGIAREDAR